jgi:LysR family transcriptional regulator, nitrogen assimilation regulatory protein
MDFKQIEYFVQVAELGSFTRAAGVLQVAQPALSRQVRALEVELRQNLFERNGRGVTLTAAGQRLLAHGRGILQQLQRARQDLEEQRGAPLGRLALGVPPSVGRLLTAPLVHSFRERFPRATLSMVEGLSTYLLDWLVQGRIDCALLYNATPAPAIELKPVLQEALFLVGALTKQAPRDVVPKPARLQEVALCELVIPSRPHALRMLLETALAGAELKPRIALEIESVPAILDLVEHSGLHAVLTANALRGREKNFVARPIQLKARRGLSTTLWMATSAQRPRGPLLEQGCGLIETTMLRLWPAGPKR